MSMTDTDIIPLTDGFPDAVCSILKFELFNIAANREFTALRSQSRTDSPSALEKTINQVLHRQLYLQGKQALSTPPY